MLSAPTGFGKTVIGAWLIAQAKVSTLVVVPKTTLLAQWRARLLGFLAAPEGELKIGRLGGGKSRLTGNIDIATFQSLIKTDDRGERYVLPEVRVYGMVIVDECHHAGAPQLECVLKRVPARRVYGLSERQDVPTASTARSRWCVGLSVTWWIRRSRRDGRASRGFWQHGSPACATRAMSRV